MIKLQALIIDPHVLMCHSSDSASSVASSILNRKIEI